MATPGLPPVVGTTPLRVSDAHAREDGRHTRQRRPSARDRAATEDAQSRDGEAADSYTHEDGGSNREQDKAEEVRRLLERALASAERQLRGDTSHEDTPLAAPTATSATVEPSPRDAAKMPGAAKSHDLPDSTTLVTPTRPLGVTSVLARYRAREDDAGKPPHALDTVG